MKHEDGEPTPSPSKGGETGFGLVAAWAHPGSAPTMLRRSFAASDSLTSNTVGPATFCPPGKMRRLYVRRDA
jgi:hypothetical protein